jgi:hypothetical protein
LRATKGGHPQLGLKARQTGDTAVWQILDINFFRRFLLTLHEFGPETSAIGRYMKFSFHPYKERPKWTPYATGASFFVCAAPELRAGLELELLWASTLGTRTGLTSDLPLDLENIVGLLFLHSMHHLWTYAWAPCPHQPPFLTKSRPQRRLYSKPILQSTKENGVAKKIEVK